MYIQVNNPSHTATAIETYQLDVESTALVRANQKLFVGVLDIAAEVI